MYKYLLSFLLIFGISGVAQAECFGDCPPDSAAKVYDVVKDYGALPDDGLPDYLQTRNAIEAADAAGGGQIFFPCGVYNGGPDPWDAVINTKSGQDNLHFLGEAPGCVFFEPDPATVTAGTYEGLFLGLVCAKTTYAKTATSCKWILVFNFV